MSQLKQGVNSLCWSLIEGHRFRITDVRKVVECVTPLFSQVPSSDPRINDDSFKNLIVSARSKIGPSRPKDDEPEDQWEWDKWTKLAELIYGPGVFNEQ